MQAVLSAVTKPSLRSKPSAKTKPSLKLKPEPSAAPWLEQEVIYCSEQAGHTHFGATDFKAGKYSALTIAGVHSIAEQHLALVSSRVNTKPFSWPTFSRSLGREDMRDMLRSSRCCAELLLDGNISSYRASAS